ncbi:MAG TPA: hypothetical protein P5326_11140 [Candidatus Contendobacter sp.]|nr:hypothetical protein [Candidatus Contendobacter sp.]
MPSRHPLFAPSMRGRPGLLLVLLPLLLGADDNYLREIEDEARRQAMTLITRPLPVAPATATAQPDAKTERLEPGLAPADFEQALRRSLPGTYALYQQLGTQRKQEVYRAYQNDSQFATLSARIAQLAGGTP